MAKLSKANIYSGEYNVTINMILTNNTEKYFWNIKFKNQPMKLHL